LEQMQTFRTGGIGFRILYSFFFCLMTFICCSYLSKKKRKEKDVYMLLLKHI